jgi:hypothetical protein
MAPILPKLKTCRRTCGRWIKRHLGTHLILKGYWRQLIGKVCNLYQTKLRALSTAKAEKRGRRDARGRVSKYIREQIANLSGIVTAEVIGYIPHKFDSFYWKTSILSAASRY